jgi:hypothetical protein
MKHQAFVLVESVSIVGALLGGVGVIVKVREGKPLGFVLSAAQAKHLKAVLPEAK